MLSFKIEGGKDLERALLDLANDRDIKLSLKRALMNKQTFAMRDSARSYAPKRTGRLAGKIEVSPTLSARQRRDAPPKARDKNEVIVYVGSGSGAAHLQEFGTSPRVTKSGKATGAVPPHPFMRPAWEQYKRAILQEFARELWVQIEKSAKRISRRQAKLIREAAK